MEKPFINAIQEFLADRCDDAADYKGSPRYQTAEREIDQLYDKIKPLLSEAGREMLLKLDDRHNDLVSAVGNVAYQKGFAEAIQLILYLLIS